MELTINRPIAFFDLETTGINIGTDRIIEIGILKVNPDGSKETLEQRINPEVHIPEEVSLIHGITDLDVKDKPIFKKVAPDLVNFLKDCDLAGYNCHRFDVPLLMEEFLRCEVDFDLKDRNIIDVQNIFHKMEQRTLKAAYKFYCDKELVMAHSAMGDTEASYEVLKAQIEKYQNTEFTDGEGNVNIPVQNDIKTLSDFSYYNKNVDLVGQIIFNKDQREVFNFGKHKGRPVEEVFRDEPSYYAWMMKSQFPLSTKKVITAIKMRNQ